MEATERKEFDISFAEGTREHVMTWEIHDSVNGFVHRLCYKGAFGEVQGTWVRYEFMATVEVRGRCYGCVTDAWSSILRAEVPFIINYLKEA